MPAAQGHRSLLGVLVLAVVLVAPACAAAAWRPHVHEAIAYARTRAGEVRFAVRTDRHVWGWQRTSGVHSLSVVKALLLVAYLDHPAVRGRRLRAADRRLIEPMIRRSDNRAATRVLAFVGAERVAATARRAGMRRFRLNPIVWGGSRIDASEQTRFFLHIDAHVVARHRRAAMRLLGSIVASQRWGVGQVRPDGWRLYFKGGWGSGAHLGDHQVALLTHGADRVSVAVLTTSSPSHAYAKQTLRGVFARLVRGLEPQLALTPL